MTATKHAPGQVVAMATHRSDREFPKTSGTRNNPKGTGTFASMRAAPMDPRYLEPAAPVEAMAARIHRSEHESETAAIGKPRQQQNILLLSWLRGIRD